MKIKSLPQFVIIIVILIIFLIIAYNQLNNKPESFIYPYIQLYPGNSVLCEQCNIPPHNKYIRSYRVRYSGLTITELIVQTNNLSVNDLVQVFGEYDYSGRSVGVSYIQWHNVETELIPVDISAIVENNMIVDIHIIDAKMLGS